MLFRSNAIKMARLKYKKWSNHHGWLPDGGGALTSAGGGRICRTSSEENSGIVICCLPCPSALP